MIIEAAQQEDERWGLFVYLTATLGTRCAETVALRTEDFDEANLVVHIRRSVSKTPGRPTIKEPKSGFPRELPIEDAGFWNFVRPYLEADDFCSRGSTGTARAGSVRSRGIRITPRSASGRPCVGSASLPTHRTRSGISWRPNS